MCLVKNFTGAGRSSERSKGFSYADYYYAIKIQYICHLCGLSGHADYVFIPKQNVQIDFKQLLDLTPGGGGGYGQIWAI